MRGPGVAVPSSRGDEGTTLYAPHPLLPRGSDRRPVATNLCNALPGSNRATPTEGATKE